MAEIGSQTDELGAGKRRAARGGGSILLMIFLIGALAIAFAFFVARQSAAITRANDTSAFQRLAIAAQGFEIWPGIAQQMAARSLRWQKNPPEKSIPLPHISEGLQHPQFGRIELVYDLCPSSKTEDKPIEAVNVDLHADAKKFSLITSIDSDPDIEPSPSSIDEQKGSTSQSSDNKILTTVAITTAGLVIKGPTVTEDRNSNDSRSDDAKRARKQTRLGGGKDQAICFTLGPIAFEKALPLPANFLSLLVIDKDDTTAGDDKATPGKMGTPQTASKESAITRPGVVIAQVGPEKLPVRSLEELPDLDEALKRKAQAMVELAAQQATGSSAGLASARSLLDSGHADTLAPLETVIAGKAYRLYPYPVSLVGKAGEPPKKLLLVGVTLAKNPFLSRDMSGARLLAFGLLLAALLALTPFMRLAFLGPVDAVKPMELATLALGLVLIGAISAALLVLGWDSVRTQAGEDASLQTQAETLATAMGEEILRNAKTNVKYDVYLKGTLDNHEDKGLKHVIVEKVEQWELKAASDISLPFPDSLFFMDETGRQPLFPTLGVAEHDRISGLYALGDRPYFIRARAGDVVPGTAQVATNYANSLGLVDAKPPGFVVEHLLSRGDGVAKTIIAFPLKAGDSANGKPAPILAELNKHEVKVVGMAMVMDSMLAPALKPGIGYAVVDLSRPGWPSVFHSDPQRAHAELFELSLGADAHDAFRLRAELRERPECIVQSHPEALPFWGTYIGKTQRLATVRVPCTDWAVVTFQALSESEAAAAQPAEIAILAWAGIAALVGAALLVVLWLQNLRGKPVMQSLWPDPALKEDYRVVCLTGLATGLVVAIFGSLAPAQAWWLALVSAGSGFALVAYIYLCGRTNKDDRGALDLSTETRFLGYLFAIITLVSIVPVVLLANDSRAYANAFQEDASRIAEAEALLQAENQRVRIWNTMFPSSPRSVRPYQKSSPCVGSGLFSAELLSVVESELSPADCLDNSRKAVAGSEALGKSEPIGNKSEAATRGDAGSAAQHGGATTPAAPPLDYREWLEFVVLAIAALLLPGLAIFSMCRNLFGFGVPLEAVDYPRLSRPDPSESDFAFIKAPEKADDDYWSKAYPGSTDARQTRGASQHADVVAAGMRPVLRLHLSAAELTDDGLKLLRTELQALQKIVEASPGAAADRPRLLLVIPKTMISPRKTLADLTGLAWEQENRPPYNEANVPWLAMLVSADDLLRRQLTDYASESFDLFEGRTFATIRRKLTAASDVAKPAPLVIVHNLELLLRSDTERKEALRLLEQMVLHQAQERKAGRGYRILLLADISPLDRFLQTSEFREEQEEAGRPDGMADASESIRWSRLLENFTTYTRRIRARVGEVEMKQLKADGKLPGNLSFLLRELNHIPDRVVQALLPDSDNNLTVDDILAWGQFLKDSRPASISDFLSSQLIEHYHYLWSISSRAEQILIHRFAAGELPNIRTAYALRSLVRRGIVVFDPAPRLMSKSFAEFIRHVERPELLSIWESNAPKGLWSRLHGNITVVLPLLLLLGVIIMLRGAVGLEAAIPLVLAAGPALLNALIGGRRTA